MKICITGFDPFGGETINPAFEAIKLLPNEISGAQIVKFEIPTIFHKSHYLLKEILEKEKPDVVLCVGQAGGRFGITVERVAINIDDARIPDNEGNQPIDLKIFEDGENAYFSNLPIKAMVMEMRKNNIPASVSNSAGTFVCNHLMYSLLYYIQKDYSNMRGGFIHVPFINSQVVNKHSVPFMNIEDIRKGLEEAIKAIITYKEDILTIEGEIH